MSLQSQVRSRANACSLAYHLADERKDLVADDPYMGWHTWASYPGGVSNTLNLPPVRHVRRFFVTIRRTRAAQARLEPTIPESHLAALTPLLTRAAFWNAELASGLIEMKRIGSAWLPNPARRPPADVLQTLLDRETGLSTELGIVCKAVERETPRSPALADNALSLSAQQLADSIRQTPGKPARFHAANLCLSTSRIYGLIDEQLKHLGFCNRPGASGSGYYDSGKDASIG